MKCKHGWYTKFFKCQKCESEKTLSDRILENEKLKAENKLLYESLSEYRQIVASYLEILSIINDQRKSN